MHLHLSDAVNIIARTAIPARFAARYRLATLSRFIAERARRAI